MNLMLLLFTALLISTTGYTQNVGIGTATPLGKLEIAHNVYKSSPTMILLDSGSMGWGPEIQFQNFNALPNYLMMKTSTGALATGANSYFEFNFNDGPGLLTIRGDHKIGINKYQPNYALDVSGNSNVDGSFRINKQASLTNPTLLLQDSSSTSSGGAVIQFKNNLVGGSAFNIKGGVSTQPNNSFMDFMYDNDYILTMTGEKKVGINEFTPNYTLDVGGELNIQDALRAGGNPGTAGQVLTSTGDGSPAWMSPPPPVINPRFYAIIGAPIDVNLPSYITLGIGGNSIFNSNPADININSATDKINIVKPGIYHFDIVGTASSSLYNSNVSVDIVAIGIFPGSASIILFGKNMPNWKDYHTFHYSIDNYFTSGEIYFMAKASGDAGETAYANIKISGHWVRD